MSRVQWVRTHPTTKQRAGFKPDDQDRIEQLYTQYLHPPTNQRGPEEQHRITLLDGKEYLLRFNAMTLESMSTGLVFPLSRAGAPPPPPQQQEENATSTTTTITTTTTMSTFNPSSLTTPNTPSGTGQSDDCDNDAVSPTWFFYYKASWHAFGSNESHIIEARHKVALANPHNAVHEASTVGMSGCTSKLLWRTFQQQLLTVPPEVQKSMGGADRAFAANTKFPIRRHPPSALTPDGMIYHTALPLRDVHAQEQSQVDFFVSRVATPQTVSVYNLNAEDKTAQRIHDKIADVFKKLPRDMAAVLNLKQKGSHQTLLHVPTLEYTDFPRDPNSAFATFGSDAELRAGCSSDDCCFICMLELWPDAGDVYTPHSVAQIVQCGHAAHTECLQLAVNQSSFGTCPTCRQQYSIDYGNQTDGTCQIYFDPHHHCSGHYGAGTITMNFSMPSGNTGPRHPTRPNEHYSAEDRVHIMPGTPIMWSLFLPLYIKAWMLRKLFDYGHSPTRNIVAIMYSSIHVKTQHGYGEHGWPDDTFEVTQFADFTGAGVTLTAQEHKMFSGFGKSQD